MSDADVTRSYAQYLATLSSGAVPRPRECGPVDAPSSMVDASINEKLD